MGEIKSSVLGMLCLGSCKKSCLVGRWHLGGRSGLEIWSGNSKEVGVKRPGHRLNLGGAMKNRKRRGVRAEPLRNNI